MPADGPLRRRAERSRPLTRKPKQLEEEPTLYEPSSGPGGGVVLHADPTGRRRGPAPARPGSAAPGVTDERGTVVPLVLAKATADPAVRARARQIAARLAVRRPRHDVTARRGAGELTSLPYRGGSDDVDLDRTLEVLAERPVPDDTDIIVRDRVRTRRSVVLAVDVSGSMRGERVRTAAATVGALAAELSRDDLAVLAFWSDATVLLHLGQPARPLDLVDLLLQLPARGLTNVAFPLEVAARELARVPARDARVVLLSDCVHNAGPDPRPLAARLSRLDVLLDVTGENDPDLARELSRAGRGRLFRIRDHRDVAPALSQAFTA
ncbi:MAG TPA: vWA domain-containing protein [Asanoa sp.]|nr:vWA domain-containing protein [Asanoa sp.]